MNARSAPTFEEGKFGILTWIYLIETAEQRALHTAKEYLCVTVDKCAGLKDLEIVSTSDPFVKVILKQPNGTIQEFKTAVKDAELNPEYKETFKFEINPAMRTAGVHEATLTFEVWDDNNVSDDMMGHISYRLSELGVAPDPDGAQPITRVDNLKGGDDDAIWCSNPNPHSALGDSLRDSLGSSLRDSLSDSARKPLGTSLRGSIKLDLLEQFQSSETEATTQLCNDGTSSIDNNNNNNRAFQLESQERGTASENGQEVLQTEEEGFLSGAVRTSKKCTLSPLAGYIPAPVMETEIGINIAVDGCSGDVDVLTEGEVGINLKVDGDGDVEMSSIDVPLKVRLDSVLLDSEVRKLFSKHVLALPLSNSLLCPLVFSHGRALCFYLSRSISLSLFLSLFSLFVCSAIATSHYLVCCSRLVDSLLSGSLLFAFSRHLYLLL